VYASPPPPSSSSSSSSCPLKATEWRRRTQIGASCASFIALWTFTPSEEQRSESSGQCRYPELERCKYRYLYMMYYIWFVSCMDGLLNRSTGYRPRGPQTRASLLEKLIEGPNKMSWNSFNMTWKKHELTRKRRRVTETRHNMTTNTPLFQLAGGSRLFSVSNIILCSTTTKRYSIATKKSKNNHKWTQHRWTCTTNVNRVAERDSNENWPQRDSEWCQDTKQSETHNDYKVTHI